MTTTRRLSLLLLLAAAGCAQDVSDVPAAGSDAPAAGAPAADPNVAAGPDGGVPADTSGLPLVTVYKSATCGCCAQWVTYMERQGFRTAVRDVTDLTAVKDSLGIPPEGSSCHTATVDGYVVEGHVPADAVRRLLRERPDATGLAVPGMPIGSPGMEQGDQRQAYDVFLVGRDGATMTVFTSIPGDA